MPLEPRHAAPQELTLRVRTSQPADAPLACWAQTRPQAVELTAAQVETYLREIGAPAAVHAQWAAMRAAGHGWRERFTKYARIEKSGRATPDEMQALRVPTGRGLEIVPVGAADSRIGRPFAVRVLQDGKPLAAQPIHFVSDRSPLGIWRHTDADGVASFQFPFTGKWMLRTNRLLAPQAPAGEWRGLFSTLVLEPGT